MPESPSQRMIARLDALAQISEESGQLTRTFATPAMTRAHEVVAGWMVDAGMVVRLDAIGNIIGHYPGSVPDAKVFMIGSHLDTVRNAGKFDGPLGVILGIECVAALHRAGKRLPCALEVAGFCDEEGVRFQSTYLGSKVLAGTFKLEELDRVDARGITMREAIRSFGGNPAALTHARLDPSRLLGYLEVHIEQGPVLEQKNLPVAVVSAIAGQSRARVIFFGEAGHAGTTPMNLRHDALCGAAEFIVAVEGAAENVGGLVATVGEISALPGAGNVIPGEARLSLDVRHPVDASRRGAVEQLREKAIHLASERGLRVQFEVVHEAASITCDQRLSTILNEAVQRKQKQPLMLHSGAGHDAVAMSHITPVAMLFVRCRKGLSHHPDEFASEADIATAFSVTNDFLSQLHG